jgi:acyl-CoA thioester hydrolase
VLESVETKLEVRWGECDPAGIVYHPAYIDWFSVARMHFLSGNGIKYMDSFHDNGVDVIVTDVTCSYKKALRAEDEILVIARLNEVSRSRMMFEYEVRNASGDCCAVGQTRHAFIDTGSRKPVNLAKAIPGVWGQLEQLPVSGK